MRLSFTIRTRSNKNEGMYIIDRRIYGFLYRSERLFLGSITTNVVSTVFWHGYMDYGIRLPCCNLVFAVLPTG